MERNWLIRTYQNQILGPVAKAKLLEFIEKGALGMNDEVTSGNGYWFMLKERDLVEKYLYGDIPQGYNPISESKSVLSKRENPDKTTSINTAPANKTQVLKVNTEPGVLPKDDDLEFPDITVVRQMPTQNANADETKLPDASDLEFPDMGSVSASPAPSSNKTISSVSVSAGSNTSTIMINTKPSGEETPKSPPPAAVKAEAPAEEVTYPKDDDLDFPDMDAVKKNTASAALAPASAIKSIGIEEVDDDRTFVVQVPKEVLEESKVPVAEKTTPSPLETKPTSQRNLESDFGGAVLSLETKTPKEVKKEKPVTNSSPAPAEEKKLLHERKTKSSQKSSSKETRDNAPAAHSAAEPLKKRNDNYIFFILIILVLIIFAVFFYFREILNKPLPV